MMRPNDFTPNGRAFKFQFDLEIQKIKLSKPIQVPKLSYLEVIWKRGQNNITCKLKPQIKGSEEQVIFGQTMSMISTCLLSSSSQQFSHKDSNLSVVIYLDGAPKSFGNVSINLSSVLSGNNYHENCVKFLDEEINPRTKARILLKLSSTFLMEMQKSQEKSIGSGIYSNGYQNTSSYSIDRRALEIPSNDANSIISYGGSVRYSAQKERRDDSAQKMQDNISKENGQGRQYNFQPNFYNRISQDSNSVSQGLKIVPSSSSRLGRNSQSDQNRSSLGEQNSRLLIDEQNKRSQLEAQITKNNVERQELKNKLTEYVRDNMKLKDELKKFGSLNQGKELELRRENEQLKYQIRELNNKCTSLEKDNSMMRNDKQIISRQNKQYQEAMQQIKTENEQFQKQLVWAKQTHNKLHNEVKDIQNNKSDMDEAKRRQFEARVKQLNVQVEYYQNNCKNLSVLLREAQNKCHSFENKMKTQEISLENYKSDYLDKLSHLTVSKDKQINSISRQLQAKKQQCTKYILETEKVKNETGKLKDQRISQLESARTLLSLQNDRLKATLKQTQSRCDHLQQQKNSLNNQVKNEFLMRSKQTLRAKQLQDNLSLTTKVNENQKQSLVKSLKQIQIQNSDLKKVLNDRNRQIEETSCNNSQIQQLMKQNLQLQLELKYKNDEVIKKNKLQEDYTSIKCRVDILESNLFEKNQSLQKCEKQLKQKNRSFIIEAEKTKMLTDERANSLKTINQLKESLSQVQKSLHQKEEIIRNGDRQVQQMDNYIRELEAMNRGLQEDLKRVEEAQRMTGAHEEKYLNDVRLLEMRNNELLAKNQSNIHQIQMLQSDSNKSNIQIRDLKLALDKKFQEANNRDQQIPELTARLQETTTRCNDLESQLSSGHQQRKSIQKKNEMLMEQLYSYKKKLEEQKQRLSTTTQIRSSDDYMKIKRMENDLEKKQMEISKLEKEVMNLESANITLNIQLMKKFEEMTPQ